MDGIIGIPESVIYHLGMLLECDEAYNHRSKETPFKTTIIWICVDSLYSINIIIGNYISDRSTCK
jgi:hypothetical protein